MGDKKPHALEALSPVLQPIASFFRAFLPFGVVYQYPDNLPLVSFIATKLSVSLDEEIRNLLTDWLLIKQHAFHFFAYEKVVFVSRFPTAVHLDERLRLNCQSGPAIVFEDGFELYFVEGVSVSKEIVDETEKITVQSIEKEDNVEVRRIMIQRYGLDRFISDSGAVEVDRDDCGILYRKDQKNDEAIMVVEVIDATSIKQGNPRHYFLRVPPYMKTARAAVAWTFNLREGEYDPLEQT
ncbi:MAG: hypothetical protein K8F91_18095 [Candidatus Obscuribacterales bacterium]|nr:hypothetical protein [Candidatus Obscuribacterales bacterium]